MTQPQNLHLISAPVPSLATAIDRWLTVRNEYKKQASDENLNAYNATYFAIGEAWREQNPEAADTPGGFEPFRLAVCGVSLDARAREGMAMAVVNQ